MITQDAVEAITQALAQEPGNSGFRIAERNYSLNGSGPAIQMELASEPEEEDQVIEDQGVRLFVEPNTAKTLEGKVLDAEIEGDEVRFALRDAA